MRAGESVERFRLSGLSLGSKGNGRIPDWVSRCSWHAHDIWLGRVTSALKEGSEVTPGVQASPDLYLAVAADGGSGAWAGAGAAWMDRTPSGDSADVTEAGSTPGGKR